MDEPIRLDLTEPERALIDPAVRRVDELRQQGRTDDPESVAAVLNATGRVQGRLAVVLLLRNLEPSEWWLGHQTDGSWYVEKKKPAISVPTGILAGSTMSTDEGVPVRRLPIDRALRQRVIAAASVSRDLAFTHAMLEKLIALVDAGSPDSVLRQALFSAALVAYARTRKPDRRQSYWVSDELIAQCGAEAAGLDKYVDELRDKHIAHSINAFEKGDLGVVLNSDREVSTTIVLFTSLMGWELNDLRRFQHLVGDLSKLVETSLDELQNQAEAAARAMPTGALQNQPAIGFAPPDTAAVNVPRSEG